MKKSHSYPSLLAPRSLIRYARTPGERTAAVTETAPLDRSLPGHFGSATSPMPPVGEIDTRSIPRMPCPA